MRWIVVPLDGSELAARALSPAVHIAERAGAGLHLVMRPDPGSGVDAPEYLATVAAGLDLAEVSTEVVHGGPAAAIVAAAGRLPESVVWMSTRGRSGLGSALVGSVAEQVVARAPMPVVLVGPEVWRDRPLTDGSELLVASDGSPACAVVAPVVAALARVLGMRVVVTEIIGPEEDVAGPGEEVVDEAGRAAADRNAAFAAQVIASGADDVVTEVGYGADAAASLAHRARGHPVALIAMATHGRTGLRRVVLGSVALRTVHLSPCPVLVVRSAG